MLDPGSSLWSPIRYKGGFIPLLAAMHILLLSLCLCVLFCFCLNYQKLEEVGVGPHPHVIFKGFNSKGQG